MTRKELIERLEELKNTAMLQDDTRPAAAVLASLQGALLTHADIELMDLVTSFSQGQIRTIRSRLN